MSPFSLSKGIYRRPTHQIRHSYFDKDGSNWLSVQMCKAIALIYSNYNDKEITITKAAFCGLRMSYFSVTICIQNEYYVNLPGA